MTRLTILLLASLALGGCGTDSISNGSPPELTLDVPGELSYVVGEGEIRITLQGEDPDGGPVEFMVLDGPERGDLNTSDSWTVFTWDPIAADVTMGEPRSLVFAAQDNEGKRSEKVVKVTITAGNGIPKFLNSNSILHNISSGEPIGFDVSVRDDDSTSVSIRMPGGFAPEGAEFTKTGEFSGRFGWLPTDDQLQKRVHTVRFIANDSQNEPVEQEVTIILKKGTNDKIDVQEREPSDCYFEDQVDYMSLGAQRGTQEYSVSASFTALGAQTFEKLVLNYTEEDIFNEVDIEWESETMVPEGDGFVASITNPLLQAGESKEIYYEICAVDEDPEDERYSIICGPTSLYESFIVYAPNYTGCLDDEQFRGEDLDNAIPLEYDFLRLRLCPDAADHFELGVGSNQRGYVYVIYPLGRRPNITVYDENQQPDSIQPEYSDCSGFAQIRMDNLGAATKKYIKIEADGDGSDIAYQIYGVTSNLGEDDSCSDSNNEPNNNADEATVISTQSASFSGLEICRPGDVDVFALNANAGQLIDLDVTFTSSVGDLDIVIFSPSEKDEVSRDGLGSDWSLGYGDEENIDFIAEESGTHYLVVYTEDNSNGYGLQVTVSDVAPACTDTDAFGNNHSQSNASYMTEGAHPALQICAGSDDWYEFDVLGPVFETYRVELETMMGNIADVEVEVWDTFGKVESSSVEGNLKVIDFYPANFGLHYLRVTTSNEVTYAIDLSSYGVI